MAIVSLFFGGFGCHTIAIVEVAVTPVEEALVSSVVVDAYEVSGGELSASESFEGEAGGPLLASVCGVSWVEDDVETSGSSVSVEGSSAGSLCADEDVVGD